MMNAAAKMVITTNLRTKRFLLLSLMSFLGREVFLD
jgi:hypothetical protein